MVFSSRAMARKLEEDVAFRVLGAGNFPSHRTLCEFRRRHLGEFKGLFVEVVRVAREMGLARFGKLSIDGTKVRANEILRKASYRGLTQANHPPGFPGRFTSPMPRRREPPAAQGRKPCCSKTTEFT